MKQLSTKRFATGKAFAKNLLASFFLLSFFLIFIQDANAVVTVTKAAGGTSISADNAANAALPAYTTIGNVIITEGLVNDFSTGSGVTLTLSAPTGWTFNPAASVSASASSGNDINANAVGVTSITSTLITVQFTVSGITNSDILTISGIQVRANDGGNVPGSANITRGGSAIISGCTAGAVLGSLSQAAGAMSKLVITLPGQVFSDAITFATSGNSGSAAAQTATTSFTITKIRACDQFFNVVTTYGGVKTLTYSGPSNGITSPSYITSVSFASGVSSTTLTTTLKKAETTSISVTDGTISGPASSSLTVNPGAVTNFLVESAAGGNIVSQLIGSSFNIKITARDANNNSCTSGTNTFTGTADISSTGTLSSGSGTTAAFSGGILSSHSVTISNAGSFTITSIKTGGAQIGISNSFTVNYPGAALTSISPSCVTPGDPGFVITVNGSNFNGTSVVQFNGSNRTTSLINSTQLHANISSADIASAGIYSISVFTPSSGSTAPLTLNMTTSSSASVTICLGSSYMLPDGISQNTSGTYTSILTNAAGCDSIISTNLTVTGNLTRTENISICPGSSYTLPDGTTQNTSGTYISTIPNPPGCDSVITTNLSVSQAPVLTATPNQIDCFGNTGSVTLNTSNGTAPFTYGPTSTTNLTAGTYNYSVTDANGCTDNTSATIDPAPSQLTLTATTTQIICFNGTGNVTLNTSGGSPSYVYSGTPVSNLTAGTYNYQVTDNNGCVANTNATINAAPAIISATTAVTNTPCGSLTGTATVTASGGTSPYTYAWNTTPVRTTRSISSLAVGNYIVTVTDNRGCTISKTATVNNSNSTPITITGTTGICPGGNTILCAKIGFPSYSWNTGETTQCITVSTADTFVVTVTDTLGCMSSKSAVTHNSTFPACTITGGTLCPNSSLTLRAPTGLPYYMWNNGIRTFSNIARNAGTYTVTVKNSDGCASTCSYTVNSPLRITVSKIDGKCNNEFKGSASVVASLGIPPYTYLWSNGSTNSSITGLAAGNYNINVADAGGCHSVLSTTIYSNKTTYDYSTIGTNFNSSPVGLGSYIWFSAVANITYTGNYPVTIRFISQNISSSKFNLVPANGKLIITNAVSQATTVYTGGEWVTTAPPNLSGNYFVAGFAYPVSLAIAANLSPVKWKGVWTSTSSCVTNIQWKWSAAAYSSLTTDNTLLNIKPVDDGLASAYNNNDFAGTPENFTQGCIAGALSTGGVNYVGTYSPILDRLPCSSPDSCIINSRLSNGFFKQEKESNFAVSAYPNPFNSRTNIEFERIDKSCHLVIDIYSFYGQKLKTIFDNDIEGGAKYRIEFDAGDLVDGIYLYRLIAGDEEVSGKLILRK